MDILNLLAARADNIAAHASSSSSHKSYSLGCHAYTSSLKPGYGYRPSLAAGLVYSVLFFLVSSVLLFWVVRFRRWWYLTLFVGALGELLGWAARAAANYCPYSTLVFEIQIAVLIFSPSFYSAGIYYILGRFMSIWGPAYAIIPTSKYLLLFLGVDVASLCVQAAGGGIASAATSQNPPGSTVPGTRIMLAGIVLQLVAMVVFMLFFLATVFKAKGVPMTKAVRQLLWATLFASTAIVVRNVYRTVELAQGWTGYLMTHEVFFAVFDGAMMVLAGAAFCFFHPARCLRGERELVDEVGIQKDAEVARDKGSESSISSNDGLSNAKDESVSDEHGVMA